MMTIENQYQTDAALQKRERRLCGFGFLKYTIILCYYFLSQKVIAQQENKYLYFYLCKSIGIVKYFHPQISKSEKDYELAMINLLQNKELNIDTFNYSLSKIFHEIGLIKTSKSMNQFYKGSSYNSNFDWILNNETLDINNKKHLYNVINYFKPIKNKFLSKRANNIEELREYVPEKIELIKGIFSFWNEIEYYYPYKKILSKNWDSVLLNHIIPTLLEKDFNYEKYLYLLLNMTAYLEDCHAGVASNNLQNLIGAFAPKIYLREIEGKTVVCKEETGLLKIGDIVTKVNNVEIDSLRKQLKNLYSGSNEESLNRIINYNVLRTIEPFKTEKLTILDSNLAEKQINVQVSNEGLEYGPKSDYHNLSGFDSLKSYYLINEQIGLIDFWYFLSNEANAAFELFKNTRSIIFDLRCYPNNTEIMNDKLFNHLSFKNNICNYASFPNDKIPGAFKQYSFKSGIPFYNRLFNRKYEGNIIILTDERAVSYTEYLIINLKALVPNCIIIGSTTSGTMGTRLETMLPGNVIVTYSRVGILNNKAQQIQKIGVVPDIIIKPTINGIRNEKDEVFEKALEYINSKN